MNINALAIDDELIFRTIYSSLFTKLNVNYKILENGKEGLEYFILHNKKIDLVFTDINMPIMDGIEMTLKIREYEKQNKLQNKKIYVISANYYNSIKNKINCCFFEKYIQKDCAIKELSNILKQYQ
jgi:CheY-like chemotaxis protein